MNDECASAIDLAKALYEKHGLDFQKDLEYHLAHGFVVALPTCFAMATMVKTKGNKHAWFIKVASGNLNHLIGLMPLPLPFIAFCRYKTGGARMKVYRTERLRALINNLSGFSVNPLPAMQ